jgi:lipid II:glycine glycyltransferase (peptidoglycan interpeptide bridge formation enzyme)
MNPPNHKDTHTLVSDVSDSMQDAEWDAFVAGTEDGHHVQTSMWAQVKSTLGWKPLRVIIKDQDRIAAGAQMLVKKYPLVGSIAYVTKGPLVAPGYRQLTCLTIKKLLQITRERKFLMLAVQPPNGEHDMTQLLTEQGFRHSALELAPTATILVDCSPSEKDLLFQLNRKTRQSIYQSRRTALTIREGAVSDLSIFYQLHVSTSKRQNFLPYPTEYFETMQAAFSPHGNFKILVAEYEGQPVSANLIIPFRDTVIAKVMGWSGEYRETRPNEALHWEIVCWAKNHGYRYVDLEGVDAEAAKNFLQGEALPEAIRHSPDQLKYGFGGKVTLYPAAYEIIFNPVYRWLVDKLKLQVARQTLSSKMLDLIRKR